MNWIRLQSEYFRHRKTLRIVRKLGELAALYPLKLWTWAVEQSPDGSLRDIDAEELTVICGHKGDAAELWAAMLDCGFLQTYEGETFIRSWEEHQGKLIERAERNAERMRAARSRNVPDTSSATDVTNDTNERNETDETKPTDFDTLWSVWARKVAKGAARKAFNATRKAQPPLPDLLATVAKLQASHEWTREGRKYQPYLATWLNREGWCDELTGTAAPERGAVDIVSLQAGGKIETRQEISTATRLANLAASLPDGLANVAGWRIRILRLRNLAPEKAESELAKVDVELLAELRSKLPNVQELEIDRKVNAARSRFASRISAEELEETCERLRASLIREHFGIPVLSLFSEEAIAA